MAIMTNGSWRTPLGQTEIDSKMAAALMRACPHLRDDNVAHAREHSLEVQIPFLQRLAGDFRFVPIVLGIDRYEELEELGHAIGQVVKAQDGPVLIIASSDMNHYENDRITRIKDRRAIDRILALDPRGLYETVRSEGITMCGYAAAVTMLVSVLDLGAKDAKLVKYATSGEINDDLEEVVGYAGLIVN
jgi:AmmeMemoRadiSam system protein B